MTIFSGTGLKRATTPTVVKRHLKRVMAALATAAALVFVVAALPQQQPPIHVNLNDPNPPHDVSPGAQNEIGLAQFAWQEFVALSWPALDPKTTGKRGRPDTTKTFTGADPGLPVWQTYRHKNEQFPAGGGTDPSFDSPAPAYKYAVHLTPGKCTNPPALVIFPCKTDLWNNLDESSEIGLTVMFAHNHKFNNAWRILYEAKVSRAAYDYANQAKLTDSSNNYATLTEKRKTTSGTLASYGGICQSQNSGSIILLPCGDNSVQGDAGEGAIETKAAWRKLTPAERKSGRFFTANVIYYELQTGKQAKTIVHNDVYGLVALHIIHKTRTYPGFVFATFEQIDDYNGSNTSGLVFHNTGTRLPDIPVTRNHPIPAAIEQVNQNVSSQLAGTKSVWRYYKLIGVQASPANGPTKLQVTPSYYYLANIAVETNQTLQNFFGKLSGQGTPAPEQNVYVGGTSYQMGGCQGCHGAAGQNLGGDMSVLLATAPFNTKFPEHFNDSDQQTVRSAKRRFKALY